jgi:hypothetical protein
VGGRPHGAPGGIRTPGRRAPKDRHVTTRKNASRPPFAPMRCPPLAPYMRWPSYLHQRQSKPKGWSNYRPLVQLSPPTGFPVISHFQHRAERRGVLVISHFQHPSRTAWAPAGGSAPRRIDERMDRFSAQPREIQHRPGGPRSIWAPRKVREVGAQFPDQLRASLPVPSSNKAYDPA